MKKLPIGISTFKTIIEKNYIYVDKTQIALELVNNGQYYFLSRPRRFGKSLFLDTLKSIFQGDKELFKGLYIYDKYDFEPYPIINISFASGELKSSQALLDKWNEILKFNEELLGVNCDSDVYDRRCFTRLIYKTYQKYGQKVVILIDEYDKPILDNIENTKVAREMRDVLKDFYSVVKGSDEYIKLVFITGVSKFSKVSLFSGLNNLNDITLDKRYSTICGYTQNDIETTFKEHLRGQDFEKIKLWYNGYKWLGEGVYNPFDILLFIDKDFTYKNYWFSTGTPTFLLKLIEKNNYFLPNFENIVQDEEMLSSFDIDNIGLETLMWQTGYLTIDKIENIYDNLEYHLVIPNREVRQSLLGSIANFMVKNHNMRNFTNGILKALLRCDFASLEKSLRSLYASIPYNLFTNNKMYEYEGYYVSVFYAYIKALGVELIGEDVTNFGRIDMTIKFNHAIYVIEFKTNGKSAIAQIKEKRYHEKYLNLNMPIYIVGIEFDREKRNIVKLEWEEVEKL
jgi:hypothetical protein